LDRLGLPKGEINQDVSAGLTAATSLRVGDRFQVSPAGGGRAITVAIEARDTLQTLARKIELASGRQLKVTVVTDRAKPDTFGVGAQTGFQRLSIIAREGKTGAILTAGDAGRDALAGLGLSQGFVGPKSGDDEMKTFGLDLSNSLNLRGADAIKAAQEKV